MSTEIRYKAIFLTLADGEPWEQEAYFDSLDEAEQALDPALERDQIMSYRIIKETMTRTEELVLEK